MLSYFKYSGFLLDSSVRTYVNLMITMVLGSFWHGASWTFVVWGALHGLFLCTERFWHDWSARRWERKAELIVDAQLISRASIMPPLWFSSTFTKFGLAMLTLLLVNVTWVFFRAPPFAGATLLLLSMFGIIPSGASILTNLAILTVSIITIEIIACHWLMRGSPLIQSAKRLPWWGLSLG